MFVPRSCGTGLQGAEHAKMFTVAESVSFDILGARRPMDRAQTQGVNPRAVSGDLPAEAQDRDSRCRSTAIDL